MLSLSVFPLNSETVCYQGDCVTVHRRSRGVRIHLVVVEVACVCRELPIDISSLDDSDVHIEERVRDVDYVKATRKDSASIKRSAILEKDGVENSQVGETIESNCTSCQSSSIREITVRDIDISIQVDEYESTSGQQIRSVNRYLHRFRESAMRYIEVVRISNEDSLRCLHGCVVHED